MAGGVFFWEDAGLSDRVARASVNDPVPAPEAHDYRTVEELFQASSSHSLGFYLGFPHIFDGEPASDEFGPFRNIAPRIGMETLIENRYPGVAIFDFDRDGDLDFYVTAAESNAVVRVARGGPNRLFRNEGQGQFTEIAAPAGVTAETHNSTAVAILSGAGRSA